MDEKLSKLLAGYGEEDAAAIRAAIADDAKAVEAAAAIAASAADADNQSSVDVADEVTKQVAAGIEGIRSELADMVAGIVAPVAESNEEETAEIASAIIDQVTEAIDKRLASVDDTMAKALSAVQEKEAVAGALSGKKPDSDATREIANADDEVQADLEKLAKDPSLAPSMLTRALKRYEQTYGPYIPNDAPRVNVATEHLSALQAMRLPGEDFHFDHGSQV